MPEGSDQIAAYNFSHALSIQILEAANFTGKNDQKMIEKEKVLS